MLAGLAQKLADRGCDSICIKDMAGIITPAAASELVSAIKKQVNLPLDLHSPLFERHGAPELLCRRHRRGGHSGYRLFGL